MDDDEIRNTVEVLLAADPDVMDRDQLAGLVTGLRRLRSFCDSAEVRVTRRTNQLVAEGRCEPAAALLTNGGRTSSRDALAASERAAVCEALPSFEDALAAGSISAGHVDALAAATRNLDPNTLAELLALEDDLLADAGRQRVEMFERGCRDLARYLAAQHRANADADELDTQRKNSTVKRWTDRQTGMRNTLLSLDPVRDAELWTAVNAKLASLRQADGNSGTPWAQLQVNAFIATVASGGSVNRVPEVSILIDYRTICDGLHARSICELENGTPIPISTARRLCCDANVLPVVLGCDGEVLDVGQAQRTANRQQRRALRAMHRTCVHPDYTVTFDNCRIHHVEFFRNGGRTDVANMVPVCEKHHHLVHEGGWKLTITKHRIGTWQRPNGTVWRTESTINRRTTGPTSRILPTEQRQPALC